MKKHQPTELKSKLDQAKELLEAENKRIVELCSKELDAAIQPILKKHNCTLVIQGQFQGNQIKTEFVVAKL